MHEWAEKISVNGKTDRKIIISLTRQTLITFSHYFIIQTNITLLTVLLTEYDLLWKYITFNMTEYYLLWKYITFNIWKLYQAVPSSLLHDLCHD